MKRPASVSSKYRYTKTYSRAIHWIALNDELTLMEPNIESISQMVTTVMVADLWKVSLKRVAWDIVMVREHYGKCRSI